MEALLFKRQNLCQPTRKRRPKKKALLCYPCPSGLRLKSLKAAERSSSQMSSDQSSVQHWPADSRPQPNSIRSHGNIRTRCLARPCPQFPQPLLLPNSSVDRVSTERLRWKAISGYLAKQLFHREQQIDPVDYKNDLRLDITSLRGTPAQCLFSCLA